MTGDAAPRGAADESYDTTDVVDTDEAAREAARQVQALEQPVAAGHGLEFVVYRCATARWGEVALRVPRYRTYRFPGRIPFSAHRSQEQEQVICAHLHRRGLPVAEPLRLVDAGEVPVLVSRFLRSEGSGADSFQVGGLLAGLHRTPPPGLSPLDHDGYAIAEAMGRRLRRRWQQVREHVTDLPDPPALTELVAALQPVSREPRLLHLDIRACNLLRRRQRIVGLVDWSCAMLAHPAVELARAQEYAQLPENGIDFGELVDGYRSVAPLPALDARTEALARLDTIVMLGVIFFAYAPDPQRQEWVRHRALDLTAEAGYHNDRAGRGDGPDAGTGRFIPGSVR